jgi:hypothetical protein
MLIRIGTHWQAAEKRISQQPAKWSTDRPAFFKYASVLNMEQSKNHIFALRGEKSRGTAFSASC